MNAPSARIKCAPVASYIADIFSISRASDDGRRWGLVRTASHVQFAGRLSQCTVRSAHEATCILFLQQRLQPIIRHVVVEDMGVCINSADISELDSMSNGWNADRAEEGVEEESVVGKAGTAAHLL